MTRPSEHQRFPTAALTLASVVAALGVAAVGLHPSVDFRPYFAELPPAVAVIVACAAGIVALFVLQRHFGFRVYDPGLDRFRRLIPVVLAIPFMVSVTLADVTLGFPPDINVALPMALIFYPAMGFVAQLALHVLPLALLIPAFSVIAGSSGGLRMEARVWASILLAASPEAAFQVSASMAHGGPSPLGIFVAAHLFLFGVMELHVFRRYDFVSMYVFRLTYYGYWHILWGYVRL